MKKNQGTVYVWRPVRWMLLTVIAFGVMGTVMMLLCVRMDDVLYNEDLHPCVKVFLFLVMCGMTMGAGATACLLCSRDMEKLSPICKRNAGSLIAVDALRWWQAALVGAVMWALVGAVTLVWEQAMHYTVLVGASLMALSWLMILVLMLASAVVKQ